MVALMSTAIRPSPGMMALYARAIFADIRSYREPMEEAVDEVIRLRIEDNFLNERAANEYDWEDLAEPTNISRERLGFTREHPILKRTGRLETVATQKNIWTFTRNRAQVDPGALTSRVPYALVHEEGAEATGRGYSVAIPQRSYLVITEDDAEKIEGIFADFLVRREIVAAAGIRWAAARGIFR